MMSVQRSWNMHLSLTLSLCIWLIQHSSVCRWKRHLGAFFYYALAFLQQNKTLLSLKHYKSQIEIHVILMWSSRSLRMELVASIERKKQHVRALERAYISRLHTSQTHLIACSASLQFNITILHDAEIWFRSFSIERLSWMTYTCKCMYLIWPVFLNQFLCVGYIRTFNVCILLIFLMQFIIVCHFMFTINYLLNQITSIEHRPHIMFQMDNCFNCKLVN